MSGDQQIRNHASFIWSVADKLRGVYKQSEYGPRRPKAALEEIVANSGNQFCPQVAAALQRMYKEEPQILGEIPLNLVASTY